MADRYTSFAELSRHEREGVDYKIEMVRRDSLVAIIAPHGGHIEPMTTEIGRAISGVDFHFYSFMGLSPARLHEDLHITSHKFDEPSCLRLVADSDVVLAVHGRQDKADRSAVCIGGLDEGLKEAVARQLLRAGFSSRLHGHGYPAQHPTNICNRGQSRRGVQLELPRSLRDRLAADPDRLGQFSVAVRAALPG
jgi:phage replication-related protein YjqB (UPF0714/DUF867 family)